MQSDRETLQAWEDLIEAVDKSNIPMKFVNRLTLYFMDVELEPQDIEVRKLRQQGYTDDQIEMIIAEVIKETKSQVYSIEFMVDIENVASEVQHATEQILSNLK